VLGALAAIAVLACASGAPPVDVGPAVPHATATADDLLVVDCLLPGQVRKLGRQFNYLTPRRPLKTSALDCEIRGGEYVAFDRANYATALAVWMPSAEEGNAEAQNYVGEIFEQGLGRTPDFAQAAGWYRRAAEQGLAAAQINLGQLYERGLGVETNVALALSWYDRAAGLEGGSWELVSSPELASLREELEVNSAEAERLRGALTTARGNMERVRRRAAARERDASAAVHALAAERKALLDERRRLDMEAEQIQSASAILARRQTGVDRAADERLRADRAALDARASKLDRRESDIEAQYEEVAKAASTVARESLTLARERERMSAREPAPDPAEARRAEAAEKQLAARERELERERTELAAREQKLADAQRELARERGELEAVQVAREYLGTFARDLGDREASLRENEESLQTRTGDLESAEAAVQRKREELAEVNTELKDLRRQTEAQRKKLASLAHQAKAPVDLAGPSIQMIDPLLVATRDAPKLALREVPMAAGVLERLIVGRVEAPAGLLSLTINDLTAAIGPNGLFQTSVNVSSAGTEVAIVAVDRQGERAGLQFLLSPEKIEPIEDTPPVSSGVSIPADVDFGRYFALVIGNDEYASMPDLESAVNDAEAVSEVLKERYRFEVITLKNASRYEILTAMNALTAKLTRNDNLLIYYAGHGELDRVNQVGHWLPVDAEPENPANWLSTRSLTDQLNRMKARHVLVVADSCYSGALTRSAVTRLKTGQLSKERVQWLRAQLGLRVRTALTSGGLKPVLDVGDGRHSLFARSLLDVLRSNRGVLDGLSLYQAISARVVQQARELDFEQMPEYAPIRHGHHENGHFLFVPRA
jgi:hypothetical protein